MIEFAVAQTLLSLIFFGIVGRGSGASYERDLILLFAGCMSLGSAATLFTLVVIGCC